VLKKIFTGFVIASAIFYIFVLYTLLFALQGRGMVIMSEHMLDNYNYWNSINIIPFKTIMEYIIAIFHESIRGHAIRNLCGNLFLLFPLGFYLPFFTQKMAKMKTYILVVVVFIVAVEIIQVITKTGSFDVDDIILNLTGALMGFIICKYTLIRSLFKLRAFSERI